MKILIDARFWGVRHTGLGRYTENLVRQLSKIDTSNDYVLLVDKDPSLDWSFLPSNFTLQYLSSPFHSLREQWELWRAVLSSNADLIHFPHYIVPLLPFKIPFIVTIHDLIKIKHPGRESSTLPLPLYWCKSFFLKLSLKKAARSSIHIITDTQVVKNEVVKQFGVSPEKISVVSLGVEKVGGTRSFDNSSTLKGLRPDGRRMTLDVEGRYLLFVGNAYPYKNVETLLKVLPLLPEDVSLVLVGARDAFNQRLEGEIKRLGLESRVKMLGFVTDAQLISLYQNAMAFVSLSLEEGFGLQPLEAMQVGCPVILSCIPVFQEVCGGSALYVSPKDAQQVARSVQMLGDDGFRQTQIQSGLERVKKYSWMKTAEETLEVYENCTST